MAPPNSGIAKGMNTPIPRSTRPFASARLALALGLAAVFAACGGPPKQEGFDKLYRGLSESLPRIDPSVLVGRTILVDPGHGGYFRGTTGRDSLEESSVNLGVSLYLWGLLREAGAEVYLTRSVDRDFMTEEDSSLASDLRARVALADSLEPDVLISIHHNAQPRRDPSKNSVETYYRAGDPASLDLAIAVHRHLMRNLGIDDGEVRQGNYLILRESRGPAVLGESSYLTHPAVEDKLKLSEIQKLEAEAYFLGILEYFERGIPRVACVSPTDSVYEFVPELSYTLTDDGGAGIDPDGVTMALNGRRILPLVDPLAQRISYQPAWDLPNGPYEVTVSARNIGGNTSPVYATRFDVAFPPSFAAFDLQPERWPPRGRALHARVRLLDRRGLPIADGTRAFVTSSAAADTVWTQVVDGSIDVVVPAASATGSATVAVGCRGETFERTIEVDPDPESASRALYLRDAVTGRPIAEALVSTGGGAPRPVSRTGAYVEAYGAARDKVDAQSNSAVWSIDAPGYLPVTGTTPPADTVEMTPWFGGALTGLRFVIDPEGGRPSETGIGPLGLSGAHANLQVARYLAGYLRSAGSRVLLTRTNDEIRTPEDIARMTNRFGADRYIEIRHRSAPVDSPLVATTYHFPGSSSGADMAQSVLDALSGRLGRPARGPYDTVTYPLQQTACPAIIVAPPSIGALEEELRLVESWYQREQAYAILLGLLDHFGVVDSGEVYVTVSDTLAGEAGPAGAAGASWRITLDGTWTLLTGVSGDVLFQMIPPGEHSISAVRSGQLLNDTILVTPGRLVHFRFTPPPETEP